MNEKNIFYLVAIGFFVLCFCWFSTSRLDTTGDERIRDGVVDSQNINSELQRATEDSKAKVAGAVERLGSAEAELDRAERSINRCQQILGTAVQRAQSTDKTTK